MQLTVEAFYREDGRLALFHGDQFIGHIQANGLARDRREPTNGTPPDRAPKRRRAAAAPAGGGAIGEPAVATRRRRKNAPSLSVKQRAQARLAKGERINAVATACGVSWPTAKKWRDELAADGALDDDEDDEPEHEDAAGTAEGTGPPVIPLRRCPVCGARTEGRYCPNKHDIYLDAEAV